MDVVYLFRNSDSVRVPIFDDDPQLFRLLVSAGGGIWDKSRQEFVFAQCENISFLGRISSHAPYVLVDEDSRNTLKVFGFFERSWERPYFPAPDFPVIIPVPSGADTPPADIPAEYPVKVNFSVFCPPSLPERFPDHWCEELEAELRSRKYSPQTRRAYVYYNRLLCRTLQKPPEEICGADITRFLAVVEKDREYTASTINIAISAVKFFYREVLKKEGIDERHRPRYDGRLPPVLSKEEVGKILSLENNPKHRLLLMLVYSSGLRVSEVVALKREHIDISRKVIYVRQGKGRKDRCTLLSEKAARFAAEYCSFFDIKTWLFPGQPATRPLSIRSAQHIFDKAVRRAAIPKKISIHGLRHTFATHLLESGTDIRYIQSLLGHSCLRSTERYTHVARRSILNIQSPLDTLM